MSNSLSPNRHAISVRALVEFCRTDGDLISQYRPGPSAFEGQLAHNTVQQRRLSDYQREVPLTLTWLTPHFELTISGRADGIFDGGVEEIKSSRLAVDDIAESVKQQHRTQALVYAAMLALTRDCESVRVRLTYVHPQTMQEQTQQSQHSRLWLVDFISQLCCRFDSWLMSLEAHWRKRVQLLQQMTFPFDTMRPAQRTMAETVYKACRTGRHATIEAPTGTGKSLASLFPALKAFTEVNNRTLYFLTMKSTGRKAAITALAQLDPDGQLAVVCLAAKTQMCLNPGGVCDGDHCPYAKNYYRKRDQLRSALFSAHQHWHKEALLSFGEQHQICPYYLSQDWAIWSDVVIGDINYLYDSTAVQPYLLKEINNRASVLIDESHNLIDRGRQMFSGELRGQVVQRALKESHGGIKNALRKIQARLQTTCQGQSAVLMQEPPDILRYQLKDFIAQSAQLLRDTPEYTPTLAWQELLFQCLRFCRLNELANPEDFVWRYHDGSPEQRRVEVLCLNPTTLLAQKHSLVNNVVAFSATLQPWHYSNALNGLADAVPLALPSPFAVEQFDVYLATDISTRFQQRAHLPDQLAPLLNRITASTKNSMVFFSSYTQLSDCVKKLFLPPHAMVQDAGWTQTERDAVLHRFQTERGLTLFTVLGGAFAEGVDLPGAALQQVVVVGPGLPQMNALNNAIKKRLDDRHGDGFQLAYVFPGLQKVLQAAGRCVRTETDRGEILLIDDRFEKYQQNGWLPAHWSIRMGKLNQWQSKDD